MVLKKKINKLFQEFSENYRRRSTRRDARIIFRMEINNLADKIPGSILIKIQQKEQKFIQDYTHWANLFHKKKIRINAQKDFENSFSHLSQVNTDKAPSTKTSQKKNSPEIKQTTTLQKKPNQSNQIGIEFNP